MLAHPAHVEEGAHAFGNAGFVAGHIISPGNEPRRTQLMPSATLGVASGARNERGFGAASRLAVGISVPALAFTGDFYVEMPEGSDKSYDVGYGLSGAYAPLFRIVLPYFEVGARRESGITWFTTQGVGIVGSVTSKWKTVWLPTIAFMRADSPSSPFVFVTTVIGGRSVDCAGRCRDGGTGFKTNLMVGLGVQELFPLRRIPVSTAKESRHR